MLNMTANKNETKIGVYSVFCCALNIDKSP